MNEELFRRYGRYYDLLYQEKDYRTEAEYIVQTLRGCLRTAQWILEFGSGTGQHGRLLAEEGYKVFGIERSETMLARAQRVLKDGDLKAGADFECQMGDIRTTILGRVFDVVLALFHVVSYQTTNDDLLLTFSNANRHLNRGGVFLFDVWHGPAVLTQGPAVRVKRVKDDSTLLTRIAEPALEAEASVVSVHYTMLVESKPAGKFVSFAEEHRMRYLFPTEIDLLARQSGFVVERSEEFVTGAKPSQSTWAVTYLLRKL
jgi:SAM-dependent methyltransferase